MPSRETMRCAHARATDGDAGRQVKIARRTGVSDTPDGLYGPEMTRSRRCGKSENPYVVAIEVLASDHLSGEMRSCATPWNLGGMNAADTRCGPAVTRSASVDIDTPFGSDAVMNRSTASSATRVPSIDISICSLRALPPAKRSEERRVGK